MTSIHIPNNFRRSLSGLALRMIALGLIVFFMYGLWVQPVAAYSGTGISIPSIGVEAPITSVYIRQFADGSVTWDVSALSMNVGHFDGTAWFGQGSNVVLGGHSELARGQADVFYQLDRVGVGDEIIVWVDGSEIRYRVTETRTVSAADISILYPTNGERLTIMTCDLGSYNASNGSYSGRIVVIAERI